MEICILKRRVNVLKKKRHDGFTLIEVLLALVVIAIALTALLKATSQNTIFANRIKEKAIGHWVEMQAISMITVGLVTLDLNRENTIPIKIFGDTWYCKGIITGTEMKHVQKITVRVSRKRDKDFSSPLIAFRYVEK